MGVQASFSRLPFRGGSQVYTGAMLKADPAARIRTDEIAPAQMPDMRRQGRKL